MAAFDTPFIPGDIEDLLLIPAGEYKVIATKAEWAKTRSGRRLVFTFVVTEGPHKNRNIMWGLNLENANSAAVEIAQRELKSICDALGVDRLVDTTPLMRKPLVLHVRVATRKDTGEKVNEVSKARRVSTGFNTGGHDTPSPRPPAPEPHKHAANLEQGRVDGQGSVLDAMARSVGQ